MANQSGFTLANALVDDIDGVSLAEKVGPNTLKAVDSEAELTVTQEGETILVEEMGCITLELSIHDEEFNEKFINHLADSLNF
jgi:hypothetical protein